jgi:XRE family aerobic/anaerobic benzoate catabolism transcriptional regulator
LAAPAATSKRRSKSTRVAAPGRPRSSTGGRADAQANGRSSAPDRAFTVEIGRLLRLGRAKRGITRRQLAEQSGTSERYLAQIESGQGNPSVIVLRALAQALAMPMVELLPATAGRGAALARIGDLLARLPAGELPAIEQLIARQAQHAVAADRQRRIALIGLRGAGKSTLGRRLADALGCPFVELDRLVEQDYGTSIPDLVEIAGMATFRRYERTCLERIIDRHAAAVIATAGGIVADPETYGLLLRRTHAIWVTAEPSQHMARVMAQGDFRPMAQNRAAMADLVAILEARRADYARAQATLDTSADSVTQSAAKLLALARQCFDAGQSVRA